MRSSKSCGSWKNGAYVPPCGLTLVHAGLGEMDEAYRRLWKAFGLREPNLPWPGVNPRFDPQRPDAEFKELLRRVGAPGRKPL